MSVYAPLCAKGHGPKMRQVNRGVKKGWMWRCLICHYEGMNRWRSRNREKDRENARRYQVAHPEKVSERNVRRRVSRRDFVNDEIVRRGGHCEYPGCMWIEDLEWHHRDPANKEFSIATGYMRSLESLAIELAKCDLLCPNHHKKADRQRRDR